MRLESDDGIVVELSPLRYQFGSSSTPRDWDANWLIIAAAVRLSDGRSWSFADPCLTTWEARELASWLRGVLAGVRRRRGRTPAGVHRTEPGFQPCQ